MGDVIHGDGAVCIFVVRVLSHLAQRGVSGSVTRSDGADAAAHQSGPGRMQGVEQHGSELRGGSAVDLLRESIGGDEIQAARITLLNFDIQAVIARRAVVHGLSGEAEEGIIPN